MKILRLTGRDNGTVFVNARKITSMRQVYEPETVAGAGNSGVYTSINMGEYRILVKENPNSIVRMCYGQKDYVESNKNADAEGD